MSDEWKSTTWRSPSNIALIKYWGKKEDQLPLNPSVSITLKNACTQTQILFREKVSKKAQIDFQEMNEDHKRRMSSFIEQRKDLLAGIERFDLSIKTKNTFPDQAGIASSASGLSALSLCLLDILQNNKTDDFYKKASHLSRLGSGSASRSNFGQFVVWGEHCDYSSYSNEFACPIATKVHPHFLSIKNAILIVDSSKKKLSSSAGHNLMNGHPYRDARLKNVFGKFKSLHQVLMEGDWDAFSQIVIGEAWELHALMMLSRPPYSLLRPETLTLIEKISEFKKDKKIKCAWTLDAGPNIHFLYSADDEEEIEMFINNELKPFTESILFDEVGLGPQKIKDENNELSFKNI